jgi:hypothetical protein
MLVLLVKPKPDFHGKIVLLGSCLETSNNMLPALNNPEVFTQSGHIATFFGDGHQHHQEINLAN